MTGLYEERVRARIAAQEEARAATWARRARRARTAATCACCGDAIVAGELVRARRTDAGERQAAHVECVSGAPAMVRARG